MWNWLNVWSEQACKAIFGLLLWLLIVFIIWNNDKILIGTQGSGIFGSHTTVSLSDLLNPCISHCSIDWHDSLSNTKHNILTVTNEALPATFTWALNMVLKCVQTWIYKAVQDKDKLLSWILSSWTLLRPDKIDCIWEALCLFTHLYCFSTSRLVSMLQERPLLNI